MDAQVTSNNVFQDRLDELFAAADPRPTNTAVVNGLLSHGCRISKPYLSQLRCGARTNPSDEVVTALATFFAVSPDYFFTTPQSGDDHHTQSKDTETISDLIDPTIKHLLRAAIGLSARSLGLAHRHGHQTQSLRTSPYRATP
ncbi:helix-turn-helix domain-containing protein [Rhodococcus qingshengii]|uniref:helix-turn-helix domain-containing protein n=1 Tax=Rhodococcus qingshengii TaxID=334542 RepID=UPI00237CD649|nr:helix-turn-helix transcriptional regulator [Rhodococcus qingshengii]WCT05829.1 helix-turn-helix transcriptional regulator [Rhodococcus qingshengii]